jgi:hypothetical protein
VTRVAVKTVRLGPARDFPSVAPGVARAVFDATRLWQRDMYEHYQLGGGSPAKAAL